MTSLADYNLEKKLGEGTFGIVFLASSKIDNMKVVIKMVKPDSSTKSNESILEFSMGKDAGDRCPYVVKYISVFKDIIPVGPLFERYYQNRNTTWMVIEYVEGYTLKQYVECEKDTGYRLEVWDYLRFLEQVFKVLSCLHNNGIIHGDLNPGNVYFGTKTRELFLIDFGGACKLSAKPGENWKNGFFSCSIRDVVTPRIFASKYINLKRERSPLNYSWTDQELRKIFRHNDIHALLTISCTLFFPELTSSKSVKWLSSLKKTGWGASAFNFIKQEYQKFNKTDTTAIFKFLTEIIKLINEMNETVTADYVLTKIKTLQTLYPEPVN